MPTLSAKLGRQFADQCQKFNCRNTVATIKNKHYIHTTMDKLLSDLKKAIEIFHKNLAMQKPYLQQEVNNLIQQNCTNHHIIERHLDTLLDLGMHNIGKDLFIQLLDYYKTINMEDAMFYRNEYDKED